MSSHLDLEAVAIAVHFRVFEDGEVIALWRTPTGPGFISSYMHVGQHGDASPDLITELREASDAEKGALRVELESIGYRVTDASTLSTKKIGF